MTYSVLTLNAKDLEAVNQFCLANPSYFIMESGEGADLTAARDIFESLPVGVSSTEKFIKGFYIDDQLVGLAEGIQNYPDIGTWIIGLFIIAEAYRNQSLGAHFLTALEDTLKTSGARTFRIGVLDANPAALHFWETQGYQKTGEVKEMIFGPLVHQVNVLVKDTRTAV